MKKILSLLLLLVLSLGIFMSYIPVSYAEGEDASIVDEYYNDTNNVGEDFCSEPSVKKILRMFGFIILILKIAIPFIIIFKGIMTFYNAVVKDSNDVLTKSALDLGKKVILGFLIFFIPTILTAILNLYDRFATVESDYTVCATCLLDPINC